MKQLFYAAAEKISYLMKTWFRHIRIANPLQQFAVSPPHGPECQSADLPHTQTVASRNAALISRPSRVATDLPMASMPSRIIEGGGRRSYTSSARGAKGWGSLV